MHGVGGGGGDAGSLSLYSNNPQNTRDIAPSTPHQLIKLENYLQPLTSVADPDPLGSA